MPTITITDRTSRMRSGLVVPTYGKNDRMALDNQKTFPIFVNWIKNAMGTKLNQL